MVTKPRQIVRDALIRFALTVDNDPLAADGGFGRISDANPVVSNGFFSGGIRTFTPPEFKQKNALWPTLGDGQMKVDIGIEEIPLVFTSARYHPGIRALYGKIIRVEIRAGLWRGDSRRHLQYILTRNRAGGNGNAFAGNSRGTSGRHHRDDELLGICGNRSGQ